MKSKLSGDQLDRLPRCAARGAGGCHRSADELLLCPCFLNCSSRGKAGEGRTGVGGGVISCAPRLVGYVQAFGGYKGSGL